MTPSPSEEIARWADIFETIIRGGLVQGFDVEFIQTAQDLAWYRLAEEAAMEPLNELSQSEGALP